MLYSLIFYVFRLVYVIIITRNERDHKRYRHIIIFYILLFDGRLLVRKKNYDLFFLLTVIEILSEFYSLKFEVRNHYLFFQIGKFVKTYYNKINVLTHIKNNFSEY